MQKFWNNVYLVLGIILGCFIILLCVGISISFGIVDISLSTVIQTFTNFEGTREQLIIWITRVPRALIAMMVGSCLAVAGTVMQALTRNPLAAPEILGINHGAALFVVGAIFFLDVSSFSTYTWFAFLGAGIVAILVYLLGSVGSRGTTPLKLTLAGAAMTTLLASLTQGILILHQRSLDEMRFWLAGSVIGRDLSLFFQVLPYMIIGLIGAMLLSKHINALSLGDDVAKGLGQNTIWVRASAIIVVVLLAGSAVSVSGPIGFIGLAVPHIARTLVGFDHKWIISYSAVIGAILLLLADVAARFVLSNQELPVGVMTAIIGAPFFIHLARRRVYK